VQQKKKKRKKDKSGLERQWKLEIHWLFLSLLSAEKKSYLLPDASGSHL
jgi:hypothetical protein